MTGGVLPFVLRRLLLVPPTLFAVLFITFAFTQAAPGDPVRIITGTRTPDPEVTEQIREEFGLTGGFFERFGDYFVGLVTRGDLGPSYFHRSPQRSVAELLGERVWVSTQLGLISLALIFLLGIPLGVFAAVNRGTWRDPFTIGFFMIFDAIPVLVLIPMMVWLLVFGLHEVPQFFGFSVPSRLDPRRCCLVYRAGSRPYASSLGRHGAVRAGQRPQRAGRGLCPYGTRQRLGPPDRCHPACLAQLITAAQHGDGAQHRHRGNWCDPDGNSLRRAWGRVVRLRFDWAA